MEGPVVNINWGQSQRLPLNDGGSDICSLVVLGDFSPVLHHPVYYAGMGVMTAKELDEVLENATSTPELTSFRGRDWTLNCGRHRWEMEVGGDNGWERILFVLEKLDSALFAESLITAFGFNFVRSLTTPQTESATQMYGTRLRFRGLMSVPVGSRTPEFSLKWVDDSVQKAIAFKLRSDGIGTVSVNSHHSIEGRSISKAPMAPAKFSIHERVGEVVEQHAVGCHKIVDEFTSGLEPGKRKGS